LTSNLYQASTAVLLAAHGERHERCANEDIARLAAALRARNLVADVAFGFIKGTPTIAEAIRRLVARYVIVYPLFLSNGYFTRVRLPQLLDEAMVHDKDRIIRVLPPLGLDPSLPGVVIERLVGTARVARLTPSRTSVVLLAHGSSTDPASRVVAQQLAERLRQHGQFGAVCTALLAEPPSLCEVVAELPGPIIVVGFFAGRGLHGGADAHRLLAEIGRADIVWGGTIGSFESMEDLVAGAVARAVGDGRDVAEASPARALQ
jgi:sirohydrochlorin ferrochelatase